LEGEKAIELVASAGAVSETGCQVEPESVDFQIPPVAEPRRMIDGFDG